MNTWDNPHWLRAWARTLDDFSIHLYGIRSTYEQRRKAARMRARADRLEGLEVRDSDAETIDYIRRIYGP